MKMLYKDTSVFKIKDGRGVESKLFKLIKLPISNKKKGDIAEAAIRHRLSLLDCEIYKSIFDDGSIDLILYKSNKFIKIQIKVVSEPQKYGKPFIKFRKSNGRKSSRQYDINEVDYFIGYDIYTDIAYIFNFSEVVGKQTITISDNAAEKWNKLGL